MSVSVMIIGSKGITEVAGCGKVGDHTHIFWDCPKLLTLGKEVKDEIMKIVHVD